MSSIVETFKRATPSQRAHAGEIAVYLRNKGFKADHLDDLVFRLAAQLGESAGGADSEQDKRVDAELSAADELNMSSMERQLEFLASHYVTKDALVNAIESALSIDFSFDI